MTLQCAERGYDFKDVLIKPAPVSKIDSRAKVDLIDPDVDGVPIIASNMMNIGNIHMAKALQEHRIFTAIQKTKETIHWDAAKAVGADYKYMIPTVGADVESIQNFKSIMGMFGHDVRLVCFDVANGHTETNMKTAHALMKWCKDNYDVKFIYGNLANPWAILHMLTELKFVPDYVKVGIGSGSVCTTRLKTGIGVPQATLLDQFDEFSLQYQCPKIISDGGCRLPSDLVKAFALGADMVMLGGMLAYHQEGVEPGYGNGDGTIYHYGNSSEKANGYDSTKNYRTVEGKITARQSRGSVHNTVQDILGGIRSACTYLNCEKITELKNRRANLITANRVADNYE
jgi:GMP reductase